MNWKDVKFLADENINEVVIEHLKKRFFDVKDVFELGLRGKPDEEILKLSFSLNRVVISHDMDFGRIIFLEKLPFKGLIYLQPGHILPEFTIHSLDAIFESDIEPIEPFIIVAEYKFNNVRMRIRNAIVH